MQIRLSVSPSLIFGLWQASVSMHSRQILAAACPTSACGSLSPCPDRSQKGLFRLSSELDQLSCSPSRLPWIKPYFVAACRKRKARMHSWRSGKPLHTVSHAAPGGFGLLLTARNFLLVDGLLCPKRMARQLALSAWCESMSCMSDIHVGHA